MINLKNRRGTHIALIGFNKNGAIEVIGNRYLAKVLSAEQTAIITDQYDKITGICASEKSYQTALLVVNAFDPDGDPTFINDSGEIETYPERSNYNASLTAIANVSDDVVALSAVRSGEDEAFEAAQALVLALNIEPIFIADQALILKRLEQSVSMTSAEKVLLSAGMLDAVTVAVNAAGGDIAIDWKRATRVNRVSKTTAALVIALGISEQGLDDLFDAAEAMDKLL